MSLVERKNSRRCPGGAKQWKCPSPCDVPYIVCPTGPVVPCDLRIGDCDASCADVCDQSIPTPSWGYLVGDQDYRKCPSLHRSCTADCCKKPRKPCCECKCGKKSHSGKKGGCSSCGGRGKDSVSATDSVTASN